MKPTSVRASGFTGKFLLTFQDGEESQKTIGLTEDEARFLLTNLQDKMIRLDYASGKVKSCPYCLEYWGEHEPPGHHKRRNRK